MSKNTWYRVLGGALIMAAWAGAAEAQTCLLPGWSPGPPLTTPVINPAVTSCLGHVYSAGGAPVQGLPGSNSFQRYDPASGAWTPLAFMPVNVVGATLGCDAAGGRIFLFGGTDPISNLEVQVYTIGSNSWAGTGVLIPGGRVGMGSGVIGGLIYLAGGLSAPGVPESQTWSFNPSNFAWNVGLAPMPAPRGQVASGTSGGKLYVMGGRDSAGNAADSNFEYDPSLNTWLQRAVLPTPVGSAGGTELSAPGACNGDLIVVGGANPLAPPAQPLAITQIYDVATNSWTAGPTLSAPRYGLKAAQAADHLLAVAGFNGTSTLATVDRIAPVPVELQTFSIE